MCGNEPVRWGFIDCPRCGLLHCGHTETVPPRDPVRERAEAKLYEALDTFAEALDTFAAAWREFRGACG